MNRKNLFSITVVLAISISTAPLLSQPTIYIVRHAEKLSTWHGEELDAYHPLSEIGAERAQRLARQFERGTLAAIFSSSTSRTLHTVLPLARKLGITVQISPACYDTTAIDSFYAELKQNFKPDQSILLVSHSNIIPYLLNRAGLSNNCRGEMGIASELELGWMVIEGYDNIWRVGSGSEKKSTCNGISRKKY